MSASDYGQTLKGMSINLLVTDIERSLAFHREVLGAEVVYADVDFAVVHAQESEWMLHADHTYSDHPLSETLRAVTSRGSVHYLLSSVYAMDEVLGRYEESCDPALHHFY